MSFYARARGEAASGFGRFPQEAVGASVGSAVFSSAPRLIAEAKQTKSNTATRLRKLCNFLPSCAILRLIRWTNARMVTGILFFFIVSAKHHAQSSDQAGERVLVLLRILGSEVLEIFFLNARRRSEPNQRAFLVCGDLRCPLTLEGADRIDFGVTLESSMHALRDPALKAAARMPLLDHYHPGMPFEIMESDVCRWLIVQPLIITVIGKAFFDCSLRFLMPQ